LKKKNKHFKSQGGKKIEQSMRSNHIIHPVLLPVSLASEIFHYRTPCVLEGCTASLFMVNVKLCLLRLEVVNIENVSCKLSLVKYFLNWYGR
jgi:hypothetical protein